jgi:F-type H+-transporting ATPase subunit delta
LPQIGSSYSLVAQRYAKALIQAAQDAKALDAVEKDSLELLAMLADSADLKTLVTSPLYKGEAQDKAMQDIAKKAKFHKITTNFFGVLAHNGRLDALEDILGAVQARLADMQGKVSASVEVAQDLTKTQITALEKSLSKSIGKAVAVDVSVNQDLLGGMVVTVGSKMFDSSVKRKLEMLKIKMSSASNNEDNVANQNLSSKKEVV